MTRAQHDALESMITRGWVEVGLLGFSQKTLSWMIENNFIEGRKTEGRKNSLRYRITNTGLEAVNK